MGGGCKETSRVLLSEMGGGNTTSLLARRAHPRNEVEGRDPLPADLVGSLLRSAVDIHNRQVRRSERWTYLLPIWLAILEGGFGLIALVTMYLLPCIC